MRAGFLRHSPPWRWESVLHRHKVLTKYGLLWPMRFRARMVQRGELPSTQRWREMWVAPDAGSS